MSELVNYLERNKQSIIKVLQEVVELESPSKDKQSVDKLVNYLVQLNSAPDVKTEILPQQEVGDCLRIEWGSGKDQILILCHIDTVWPVGEIKKRPVRIEDNKMYGPGIYDMKGGTVQAFFALRAIRELGIKTDNKIVFLCNTDEEIGSEHSRAYIEKEAQRSKCVLVPEPTVGPDGAVKMWRKGWAKYDLAITGKPAHAGTDHEKGINAVHELAHQILKLEAMTDYKVGTTVNVGVAKGGYLRNVVPEFASAEIDVRMKVKEEALKIEKEILGLIPVLKGTVLNVSGKINRPPLEPTQANQALYAQAQALAREIGFELKASGVGGVSDGNITSDLGIPTLDGIGAVGDGAHALHEHVDIDTLVPRTALMAKLLSTF